MNKAGIVQYRARTVVRLLEFLDLQCGVPDGDPYEFEVLHTRVQELMELFDPLTGEYDGDEPLP